jgi:hypothetical protein
VQSWLRQPDTAGVTVPDPNTKPQDLGLTVVPGSTARADALSTGQYTLSVAGSSVLINVSPWAAGGFRLAEAPPICKPSNYSPAPGGVDDKSLQEECKGKLCVTPGGTTYGYGLTSLTDRSGPLTVELWAPITPSLEYSMTIDYEKSIVTDNGLKPSQSENKAIDTKRVFFRAATETVDLTSGGKLKISVTWKNFGPAATISYEGTNTCTADQAFPTTTTVTIAGHYYFMLGFMPTYAGLFDRKNTLHHSDDGVQRLFQQDVQDIDYTATLTAFPGGIDEGKTRFAVGGTLGTSIRNPGKRWYLGLELTTPINIGIVGGAGLIVVDALDRDFVVGQPLSDTSFPTHSTVVPTWFIGVNVEAELFKKAFKGIAGND